MTFPLLASLILISAAGCGTIYSIGNNEPFPNIVYGGIHFVGHNALDLPFCMVADTVALPYTIPRSIYNSHHPEDRPKEDAPNTPATAPSTNAFPQLSRESYRSLVAFLRLRGITVGERNGDLLLPANAQCERALIDYLQMLGETLRVIDENIINLDTIADATGANNPYRSRSVLLDSSGSWKIVKDDFPPPRHFDPGNPLAGKDGLVLQTDVSLSVENVKQTEARLECRTGAKALFEFETGWAESQSKPKPPTLIEVKLYRGE